MRRESKKKAGDKNTSGHEVHSGDEIKSGTFLPESDAVIRHSAYRRSDHGGLGNRLHVGRTPGSAVFSLLRTVQGRMAAALAPLYHLPIREHLE